jgi:hypothetical protein
MQMPKRLLHVKLNGKRKVGRPKSRWLYEVNTDARKMVIRMSSKRALN